MTITFVPGTTTYGSGALKQRPLAVGARDAVNYGALNVPAFVVEGSGDTIVIGNGALKIAPLTLRAFAGGGVGLLKQAPLTIEGGGSGDLVPAIGVGSLSQVDTQLVALGDTIYNGDGYLYTDLTVFGTDTTGIGRFSTPLHMVAHDASEIIEKQAILVLPGAMLIVLEAEASLPPLSINDTISFAGGALYRATWVLFDQLGLNDKSNPVLQQLYALASRIGFSEQVITRLRLILAEVVAFNDTTDPALALAIKLVDTLGLHGRPDAIAQAFALAASVVGLRDNTDPLDRQAIHSAMEFLYQGHATAFERGILNDVLGLDALANNTLLIAAVGRDVLGLHATAFNLLTLRQAIESGIAFQISLRTGDETYTTWVMNADNQAFRTYENYPFNSYARIGDDYYGASEDGIYLLDGDTDDGEPIDARIRTGLMNFGSLLQKRFEKAYFGLSTDGTMLLRVYTTSPQGEKVAYTYRMNERPRAVAEEARIAIGRGLESVYWSFELLNDNGANFEISDFELLPMTLTSRVRRK